MEFFSKNNLGEKKSRIFDKYDTVDRISYKDTNTQILEMLSAGRLLKYSGNENVLTFTTDEALVNSLGVANVVYPPDVTEASKVAGILKDEISSLALESSSVVETKSEVMSDGVDNGELGKPEPASNGD